MSTRFSFKAQITWLSTGLILLTVIFLTISNWFRFADYAETQVEQQIYFAQNVLNQTLKLQEQILITSASVLASDFGFKQAVASQDQKTLQSVLLNHGKRINADLMLILNLDGDLITSSSPHSFTSKAIEANINTVPFREVHAQILSIENKVFQVIVVPVKAPRVIAYAVVGFEFGHKAMRQLKDLIALDVSLVQKEETLIIIESSIEDSNIKQQALLGIKQKTSNLLLTKSEYYHTLIKFSSSNNVHAILSVSLSQIQSDFNRLIFSILMIACIAIVIAITFSRVLSKNLSKPLNTLMEITEKISCGELDVPKLTHNLPIEFTELYQGFVVMGLAIDSREREITYQAERDVLTGLFNRYKALNEISRYLKDNIKLVLITCNIKDLKTLNDTIGINNADNILKEIAIRINIHIKTQHSGNNGFAARVNPDEFLICMPIDNNDAINEVITRLRENLEKPVWVGDIKINLCIYYGIVNSIEYGTDAERLIRRSIIAISSAYQERVLIRYYQEGDDEVYLSKLRLIEELEAALDNPKSPLFMNYQPKINIKTGKVDKLEALIRWINHAGEFVNPEFFIGLAEKSGLIVSLSRWVILQVIKQINQWNQRGFHFKVSINLSAQDIQNDDFVDYLLITLNKYNVTSAQIILELTERDLADDESLVAERLCHLKSLGFEISVDDYGIGQSSLAKLKHLPVDELKIDKTFILRLDQSQKDQDIVSSTISLGHKLGLRVVAEGVENKKSLELLTLFQCDYAQGYYLSKPMNADKFIEWYESNEYSH